MCVFLRPGVKLHHFEFLIDNRITLGFAHAFEFKTKADIVFDGAPGQQSELLKHHRHAFSAHRAQRVSINRRNIHHRAAMFQHYFAARDFIEAIHSA